MMAWRVSKDTFALEALKVLLKDDEYSFEQVVDHSCNIAGMMVARLGGEQAKADDPFFGSSSADSESPVIAVMDDFDGASVVHGEVGNGEESGKL
jgi:hypothetical protein